MRAPRRLLEGNAPSTGPNSGIGDQQAERSDLLPHDCNLDSVQRGADAAPSTKTGDAVSRLTDLIHAVKQLDSELGIDLEAEVAPLQERLPFGLNFEKHQPEAVQLPGVAIRVGSKVRILPPRKDVSPPDGRLWVVEEVRRNTLGTRCARISLARNPDEMLEDIAIEDLVLVAEFRDPIYPGMRPTGAIERGGDRPFHSVINGENFHVLEALTFTHRGRVDAIYIDPPYNTGARDWKYSNDYVEGDDLYRHSKWLAFMERRLLVSKKLLNPSGSVLIATIDEKEYLRLGLLLEQVFPEARIQMVSIVINPNGVARSAELSRVEEYAYFCFFGSASPALGIDSLLDQGTAQKSGVRWEWLMRGGSNSRRIDRPNLFYPIYVDETAGEIVEVGEPIPLLTPVSDVAPRDGLLTLWPIRANGAEANWRTSPEYLSELLASGYARLGERDNKTGRWSVLYLGKAQIGRIASGDIKVVGRNPKGYVELESDPSKVRRSIKTVWNRGQHSAGEYGSRMIRDMLPHRTFPFPKSLYAVEDALRVAVGDKKDAIILDFFAGSGTTAHAVMRLNKQDGGRRQAILVTNNEVGADEQRALRAAGLRQGDPEWERWGICDYITKPRIESAITGRTPEGDPLTGTYRFTDEFPLSDGFSENAAFFTLTYESVWRVSQNRAFAALAPLLWLRAGSSGRRIDNIESGWDVADSYGVLQDLDKATEFATAVRASDQVKFAFIITDDDRRYQMVCEALPQIESIRLYSSYLQDFQINSGVLL